jgi:hypothetical protein
MGSSVPVTVHRRSLFALLAVPVLAGAGHCGGTVQNPSAPSDALDAGLCEGTAVWAGSRAAPVEHRSQSVTCEPSATPLPPIDAATVSCTSNMDCQTALGNTAATCLQQQCTFDQCLTDKDCLAGEACICAGDNGGGDRIVRNTCVPATCHLDSDCGAGQYCTPSRGYCGGVAGLYCTTKKDTCVDFTTDCACGGSYVNGGEKDNACVYAPQVGYWVCGAVTCSG